MTNVAYIGLGIMGRGMARNLLAAGHQATVWNRTPRDLPDDLSAATVAETAAGAAKGKPVVFVCLTGPRAQEETLPGEGGLLAGCEPGAIVVDCTTTDPTLTETLAAAAAERGLRYLDCPVFGSRTEAWEGRLDFVCGGDRAAFDEALPLLDCMAATVHYMGGTGKGAAAKLVGNTLVAAQLASLGEALALARKAGIDGEALMGYLDVTDFSSGIVRGVGRASLAGDYAPSFYLKHMLKDAGLIGDYARSLGVAAPTTALIGQLYQGAVNKGLGELNASALHQLIFEMSGLE